MLLSLFQFFLEALVFPVVLRDTRHNLPGVNFSFVYRYSSHFVKAFSVELVCNTSTEGKEIVGKVYIKRPRFLLSCFYLPSSA